MDAPPTFSFSTVDPNHRSEWIETPRNIRGSGTVGLSPRTCVLLQDFRRNRAVTSNPCTSPKLKGFKISLATSIFTLTSPHVIVTLLIARLHLCHLGWETTKTNHSLQCYETS